MFTKEMKNSFDFVVALYHWMILLLLLLLLPHFRDTYQKEFSFLSLFFIFTCERDGLICPLQQIFQTCSSSEREREVCGVWCERGGIKRFWKKWKWLNGERERKIFPCIYFGKEITAADAVNTTQAICPVKLTYWIFYCLYIK